jgi:hypothetical protein
MHRMTPADDTADVMEQTRVIGGLFAPSDQDGRDHHSERELRERRQREEVAPDEVKDVRVHCLPHERQGTRRSWCLASGPAKSGQGPVAVLRAQAARDDNLLQFVDLDRPRQ